MKSKLLVCMAATCVAGWMSAGVDAAVLTNPVLVAGAGAIDPAGAQTIDTNGSASGSNVLTPQATLEARTDFQAIQQFTDNPTSGSNIAAGTNYLSFSDPTLPDVRLSFSGSYSANSGRDINNLHRVTSGTSALEIVGLNSTANTATLNITFGSYDSTSGAFATGVNSVAAVGFAVANLYLSHSAEVSYFDSLGNLLNIQTARGSNSDLDDGASGNSRGRDVYFGFETPDGQHDIATVAITLSGGVISAGIDDIGFATVAAVPEPATAALLTMGGLVLLARRR
ncbi:MAG TPA: PEP-CTERM sorting domain-containing protein [Tepidisphaeraceae bacterium]|nr:PEP-CTERM sorting domain-containing protein [Tepidisphaeraceae bacterium]